jgi:hypothetical protein
MLSIGLWRWYILSQFWILSIGLSLFKSQLNSIFFKHNVSGIGFCLRLQLGPLDRASLCSEAIYLFIYLFIYLYIILGCSGRRLALSVEPN